MCKVFFSARIINHDTGHNKFISENISISNEKCHNFSTPAKLQFLERYVLNNLGSKI